MNEPIRLFIAQLPEGDDPDSFVRREGPAAFMALVEAAVPAYQYRLSHTPAPELPPWMPQGDG